MSPDEGKIVPFKSVSEGATYREVQTLVDDYIRTLKAPPMQFAGFPRGTNRVLRAELLAGVLQYGTVSGADMSMHTLQMHDAAWAAERGCGNQPVIVWYVHGVFSEVYSATTGTSIARGSLGAQYFRVEARMRDQERESHERARQIARSIVDEINQTPPQANREYICEVKLTERKEILHQIMDALSHGGIARNVPDYFPTNVSRGDAYLVLQALPRTMRMPEVSERDFEILQSTLECDYTARALVSDGVAGMRSIATTLPNLVLGYVSTRAWLMKYLPLYTDTEARCAVRTAVQILEELCAHESLPEVDHVTVDAAYTLYDTYIPRTLRSRTPNDDRYTMVHDTLIPELYALIKNGVGTDSAHTEAKKAPDDNIDY